MNFAEFLRTPFFTEHLRVTACTGFKIDISTNNLLPVGICSFFSSETVLNRLFDCYFYFFFFFVYIQISTGKELLFWKFFSLFHSQRIGSTFIHWNVLEKDFFAKVLKFWCIEDFFTMISSITDNNLIDSTTLIIPYSWFLKKSENS